MAHHPKAASAAVERSKLSLFLKFLGVACTAMVLFWVVAGTANAGSWSKCRTYAERALAHQRENKNWRCGLRGPHWSHTFQRHFNWCRRVNINLAYQQSMRRLNALGLCKAKYNRGGARPNRSRRGAPARKRRQPARACAWRRFPGGYVNCVCVFTSNTTVTRIVPRRYCAGIRRY